MSRLDALLCTRCQVLEPRQRFCEKIRVFCNGCITYLYSVCISCKHFVPFICGQMTIREKFRLQCGTTQLGSSCNKSGNQKAANGQSWPNVDSIIKQTRHGDAHKVHLLGEAPLLKKGG
mmetsp:Transcript_16501/g.27943  ORF Transcript_16501/g.27943 Transcript_16501/m.27943 type:complete len:119 (-) Transcript_16501:65-421(-)